MSSVQWHASPVRPTPARRECNSSSQIPLKYSPPEAKIALSNEWLPPRRRWTLGVRAPYVFAGRAPAVTFARPDRSDDWHFTLRRRGKLPAPRAVGTGIPLLSRTTSPKEGSRRPAMRTHHRRGAPGLPPDVRYCARGVCGNVSKNRLPHHFGSLGDRAGHDLVLQLDHVAVVQPQHRVSEHRSQFTPPCALAPDDADGSVWRKGLHRIRSAPILRKSFAPVRAWLCNGARATAASGCSPRAGRSTSPRCGCRTPSHWSPRSNMCG